MNFQLALFVLFFFTNAVYGFSQVIPIVGIWKGVTENGDIIKLELTDSSFKLDCANHCDDLLGTNRKHDFDVRSYFYSIDKSSVLKFIPYQIGEDDLFLIELLDSSSIKITRGWHSIDLEITFRRVEPVETMRVDENKFTKGDFNGLTQKWQATNIFGLNTQIEITEDTMSNVSELYNDNDEIEIFESGPKSMVIMRSLESSLENTFFVVLDDGPIIQRFEIVGDSKLTQHHGGRVNAHSKYTKLETHSKK